MVSAAGRSTVGGVGDSSGVGWSWAQTVEVANAIKVNKQKVRRTGDAYRMSVIDASMPRRILHQWPFHISGNVGGRFNLCEHCALHPSPRPRGGTPNQMVDGAPPGAPSVSTSIAEV